MDINLQEELRKFKFCEEHIKNALSLNDSKFINSATIIKYLNDKAKKNRSTFHQELMVLYSEIYNNGKYTSTIAVNILHHLERIGFSGINKIDKHYGMKQIDSYYVAEILQYNANDFSNLYRPGKQKFASLRNYLSELGYEMFTSNELKQLFACGFNFYGEGASAEELVTLGLTEDLVYKIIRNNMLINGVNNELYRILNQDRFVKLNTDNSLPQNSDGISEKSVEQEKCEPANKSEGKREESRESLITSLIVKSNIVKNISLEDFKKHAPKFPQKYSDRAIVKRMAKQKQLELSAQTLTDNDLLEFFTKNPNKLHCLDEGFVSAHKKSLEEILRKDCKLSENRKIYMQKQLYKIVKNYLRNKNENKV